MPPAYLHGVETVEVARGSRPIRSVRTAVVGLVGTAPIYQAAAADQTVNQPVLIASEADAARYFGTAVSGFTIPQALRAIFAQGRGVAIVVNVFDPAIHKTAVAATNYTVDAQNKITLPHQGVRAVVVRNTALTITYVEGADYTLDAVAGVITRLATGAIPAGATVTINYDRPDPTLVTTAQVIGTTDAAGNRTGMQALVDAASRFGFGPKLLVAPSYGTLASVVTELDTLAGRLRAVALVDAPIGTTVANAIAGRGAAGTINFATSSQRVVLCYPHVRVFDLATNAEVTVPLSTYLAGAIAARDERDGYHFSPSNVELRGVIGLERPLTAGIADPNSEVNRLNEAGILTVLNAFGTGFRVWGNRSAAYPTDTHPRNFIPVRRTADVLHESIEQAMLQFLDQPISDALIDAIVESVNAFIRALIGRGALIGGGCTFDPTKNPATEIAAGHLTFDVSFMPPTPAERVTFESFIDINLLRSLGAQLATA
jgi:phage tail sheath protein FI